MRNNVEQAARYNRESNDQELFSLAAEVWPDNAKDLTDGVAEVCRYAFIRAAELGRADQHLWRARAMTAALLTGDRDTGAGLLLQPFFVATSHAVQADSSEGHAQARKILDMMKFLVEEGSLSWVELFGRLYHGKRAFSFLMEATGGGRPRAASSDLLDAAHAEYAHALELTADDERKAMRLRAGQALVHYLKLAHRPDDEVQSAKQPMLEQTRGIMAASLAAGYHDVEGWAATNVAVMERGEFSGWTPYDVI